MDNFLVEQRTKDLVPSFDELMKAFEIRDIIQTGISQLMHDEDDSSWQTLLQEQEDYIQEYIDRIGDFNNGCLVKNIAYLLKKYGLRKILNKKKVTE